MRNFKLQPVLYVSTGDGEWSSTPTLITNAYDIDVGFRLGELNDDFTFKVSNKKGTEKDTYHVQDRITIHFLLNNDSYSDTNMLINGLIKSIDQTSGEKGNILNISGVSFGEVSTTGLVFATSISKNVMEHIDNCRNSINLRNSKFGITWNSSNPLVKSNGSAFPKLPNTTTREYDKSFYKILETYLTNEYTGDGNYYWYINNNKELVIRKREITSTANLTEGTDNIMSFKIKVDTSKIYNFIVVKCGTDPNGIPISTRYDDPVSRAQYGFKYYMLTDSNISTRLLDAERYAGSFTTDSKLPPSYPYTIQTWKDNTGSSIVVSTDKEWIDAFRLQVKLIGQANGKDFSVLNSKKLHQLTAVLVPINTYVIGSLLNVNIASYGLTDIKMRVIEIAYSDENTMLTLVEEVATVA